VGMTVVREKEPMIREPVPKSQCAQWDCGGAGTSPYRGVCFLIK
jgi:hypothetical protein